MDLRGVLVLGMPCAASLPTSKPGRPRNQSLLSHMGMARAKKAPAAAGLFRARALYFGLVEPEPELGVLAVPLAPAPAGEAVPPAVRVPSTSISTRRSGCRQATSFLFEPFSGPIFAHSLPVTGSDSPLPAALIFSAGTPLVIRYSFTDAARCSESFWLYCSEAMRSACPVASISSTLASLMRPASSSSFCLPESLSVALSKSKRTSEESVTFSITGGRGAGAAAKGAGAGAAAGGGGGGG